MKKLLSFVLLISAGWLAAQQTRFNVYAQEMMLDQHLQPNYILFKNQYRVSESQAVDFISSLLYSNDGTVIQERKRDRDELGFTTVRYDVVRAQIKVDGMTVLAHYKEGKLQSINGELSALPASSSAFAISESAALSAALNKVNAVKYMWENKTDEANMRNTLNDPAFSYEPKAEKVLVYKDGKVVCAYKFNIYAEEPLYRANVLVDATSAKVIEEQNLICTVNTPGTGVTKYSGTQTLVCDQNGAQYTLKETTRGLGIETYNCANTMNYVNTNFTSTSATWTLSTVDQGALDAHWGAEKTYDYYWYQHNRNSINNNGFKLVSYVHYGTNYTNAFWDGSRMTYGDGNGGGYKIFTALDVCGHEITHGLTSNTGNLAYTNESGALNESFSDIFGACIENFGRPTNWNWKVGEDLTNGGGGLRSMSNPNSFGDPDCYAGANWYTGTADNGGVHTNSGVGNFWFYLLTAGGSGTNDLANTYSVSGLGFTAASNIAFRALTVYFTPTTNYATARSLCIQAAKDLYGDCSNEMIQTMNAWHAVGVGNKYIPGQIGANFKSDYQSFCTLPVNVSFLNLTPYAQSYVWNFGDGSTATFTSGVHTYTSNGTFTVKMKATGCNATDSVTKAAYIVINVPASPQVNAITACLNAPITLTATGTDILKWYDAPNGNLIATGSVATGPAITTPTTYYVANTIPNAPVIGGLTNSSSGAGGYLANSNQWLVFDVVQTGTLNSVTVYASTVGTRTIELRNSANVAINSVTANLAIGANTIILYFPLSVGNNYRLALGAGTANLYRTNSGVSYPYNVGGCINIVNSSAGLGSYYWFYSWEVTKEDCTSPLVPVTVNLAPSPTATLNAIPAAICKDDVIGLSGSPTGGTFSGPGVSGPSFSGSNSGAGTFTVTYTYTDLTGCSGSDKKVVQTSECTGLEKNNSNGFAMFPNPVNDKLNFVNISAGQVGVRITDVAGRTIQLFDFNSTSYTADLSALAPGIYFVQSLNSKDEVLMNTRIVKN